MTAAAGTVQNIMGTQEAAARAIVIGAGPVGLLTALRLAKAKPPIPVTVLEALPGIVRSPRAAVYQPVAVHELDKAGVLQDARRKGTVGRNICWRKTKTGEIIAEMSRGPSKDNQYENLVLGQDDLADIILEHFEASGVAKVLWEHKVVEIDQDEEDKVKVIVEDKQGKKITLQAEYAVGADGGRSSVRRILNVPFEGFTWEDQIIATNVYYPFAKHGFYDGNFMCDKEDWALIAKLNEEGLYRCSYAELGHLTEEEARERLPMKFEKILPGPRPLEYNLVSMSPYRIHQRCASSFRWGRVLLAGDAAHLCNPFGGLGLTGGLLDAGALGDALIAVLNDRVPEGILDKYAEVRREIFLNNTNPMSQANIRRLHEPDIDTLGDTDPFLRAIRSQDMEELSNIRWQGALSVDLKKFIPDLVAAS